MKIRWKCCGFLGMKCCSFLGMKCCGLLGMKWQWPMDQKKHPENEGDLLKICIFNDFCMNSWKQKRCGTLPRSFSRQNRAEISYMDPIREGNRFPIKHIISIAIPNSRVTCRERSFSQAAIPAPRCGGITTSEWKGSRSSGHPALGDRLVQGWPRSLIIPAWP